MLCQILGWWYYYYYYYYGCYGESDKKQVVYKYYQNIKTGLWSESVWKRGVGWVHMEDICEHGKESAPSLNTRIPWLVEKVSPDLFLYSVTVL